jgi:CRP-like cAMP-binding protein
MLLNNLPVVNKILASLPRSDYQRLLPGMEEVTLNSGDVIGEAGRAMRYVYFPADAMLSLLTLVDKEEVFTVALVGREGMSNLASALGAQVSPVRTLVLGTGSALRMKVRTFVKEFRECEPLRNAVLRYVHALTVQISENAACNRFHAIEQRLARWLLMLRDRFNSDHFHTTQETMGHLLGVRRVGVTNAALALKQQGLIDYSRGALDIVDGNGLRLAACSCYRVAAGRHGVG